MNETGAAKPVLRLHFDLEPLEYWHRREWEQRLESMSRGMVSGVQLVDRPEDADCVMDTPSRSLVTEPFRRQWWGAEAVPENRYSWDASDAPIGRLPGFYCSLPRSGFDPRRHRSFCYPLIYNEQIEWSPLREAAGLYGFTGGISSGLRARLAKVLANEPGQPFRIQPGAWNAVFDRSGLPVKKTYAADLIRSRFILCPRGNGVASIRLFETMQAGRIPVIISDAYVLPEGIDWPNCSIRVREREIADIPRILRGRDADSERLATNARRAWEEQFSDDHILTRLGERLRDLMAWRTQSSASQQWSHNRRLLRRHAQLRIMAWAGRAKLKLEWRGKPAA